MIPGTKQPFSNTCDWIFLFFIVVCCRVSLYERFVSVEYVFPARNFKLRMLDYSAEFWQIHYSGGGGRNFKGFIIPFGSKLSLRDLIIVTAASLFAYLPRYLFLL